VRSYARIPKEIPIPDRLRFGRPHVFRAPYHCSPHLHGAGVLSRHKLSPEQELIPRWPDKNKEADIRIVGQIGEQSGRHTYGVAFFDLNLNFWEIDFPPISDGEKELDVYAHADVLAKLHPNNAHVRDKIRQQLQVLRDLGLLEFLAPGPYRLP